MKTMLTKKVLPLNTDPFIKTYPYNAFYLGVLEANGFDISDILINEFFHLHYYSYKGGHIDFCGSGYVEKHRFITKYDIKLRTVSIGQIKNKIDNNFYLMVNLNEKYLGIPEIQWDWDRCHDWLVYGYDDLKNEFYCCGYINKKGIGEYYGTIKVKYYDLIASIKKVPKSFTRFRPRKLQNHSLKINPTYSEKCISNEQLLRKLKQFYNPKIVSFYNRLFLHNDANGIRLFIKSFKKEHINIYDNNASPSNNKLYLQEIRNLYEHKKVIKLVLERIGCCQDIIEKQNKLVKESYENLLLCAKYNTKPQQVSINHIFNKMIDIEIRQQTIIIDVLKNMKSPFSKNAQ